MINLRHIKEYCKDYTKIENYEKAMKDETQVWECHHRLEIAPCSGKKISMKFLKEQGLYYNQPPEALIFLTTTEHNSLHHKGKEYSDELRKKYSLAHIGTHFKKKVKLFWFTDGQIEIQREECPEGFKKGRLKRK